jgi:metallo-beta-lactamase family protein
MKIKFCGAAQTVTGSQHLLEINGKKILLDCGLYQGRREEAYDINKKFLFDPKEIHAVILSHAHIDHSGNLPSLVRQGFEGCIYSTTATRDLCSIMLQDSAHIQEKDIEYANKKRARKHLPPYKPLYTSFDVINTLSAFKTMPYYRDFYIDGLGGALNVKFIDAGHILGSAEVVLKVKENGREYSFGFTGDLGRPNLPILKDPDFMGNVNFIISESTYGGKQHDNPTEMEAQLAAVINEGLSRGGKIIVPAFSVGRTQEIVYALSGLLSRNEIPQFPVFVDSPLSTSATNIFKLHPECYDRELSELIARGVNVFELPGMKYITKAEDSKKINALEGPAMIISASGMAESGRVLHHLKNNIEDKNATVLIVGFMAEHTLGRRLVEAKDNPGAVVNIFGEEHKVNAKVVVLNSFSAHADGKEMLDYFNKFDRKELQQVYLVHGEIDRQEALKKGLNELNFNDVIIPNKGMEIEI